MPITLFSQNQAETEAWLPPPDRVVTAGASGTTQNHFESSDGRTFAGVWRASRGSWRVRYDETEYCHMTKGRARITSSDGTVLEVQPGDGFVVPPGFEGVWEVLEDMEKHYVIVLPHSP